MDDHQDNLARKLADNSMQAFTSIYDEYFDRLLDLARSFLENRQDAEDICADVFTNLWEMRSKFDNIRNIKGFLYMSVRNGCLDLLKSAKVKQRSHVSIDTLEQIDPEQFADVRIDYKNAFRKRVNNLPSQCKLIFELAYFEHLTNDEIAARLQITKRTVTNQKVKAKNMLRAGDKLLLNISPLIVDLFYYLIEQKSN